jgi:hypothetical protein
LSKKHNYVDNLQAIPTDRVYRFCDKPRDFSSSDNTMCNNG